MYHSHVLYAMYLVEWHNNNNQGNVTDTWGCVGVGLEWNMLDSYKVYQIVDIARIL